MGVDHAIDVRPRLENLRMDVNLAVPPRSADHDIALQVDREDILHRDLVEPDTMRLHEKQVRSIGQAKRNMAAGEIILAFGNQILAGDDELVLERAMGRLTASIR
jgi:hypothetical protein